MLHIDISGSGSKRHQRGGKDAERRPHDPEDGGEHDNLQAHSQRDQGLAQREQGRREKQPPLFCWDEFFINLILGWSVYL